MLPHVLIENIRVARLWEGSPMVPAYSQWSEIIKKVTKKKKKEKHRICKSKSQLRKKNHYNQDRWKGTWREEEMKRKNWNSYLIMFQRDGTLKKKFCKEVIRDNDTPTKLRFLYPLAYAA